MPSLISVLFCLKPRARGQSALIDSLQYLSNPAPGWDHTVVCWTGEIPGNPSLSSTQRAQTEKDLSWAYGIKVAPVWLTDAWNENSDEAVFKDQGRWRRYAEHELYTLFHYKQHEPTDGRKERVWWADYVHMNKLFANRIFQIYKPGDLVWIHDYHLFLLPSLLRQKLPQLTIGFYLHIPFPSSEYLRCLSRRQEILEGVLGANLIGFQSSGYAGHFSSCCKRILGVESSPLGVDAYGACVAIGVFPVGIAVHQTERYAFGNPTVQEKVNVIQKLYTGRRLIIGRDRLDSVKGITQKLQAFEQFMERYPEWRGRVVLIQVVNPVAIEDEKENDSNRLANRISELVERINGRFGSMSFAPVRYYPKYISKEEYFALLQVADVGLITSIRDGMNTTALEYALCQKDNHGPLILSEFSATAGSVDNAMHINPWDLAGVAKCLDSVLSMSADAKAATSKKLYSHVSSHGVREWAHKYLAQLQTIAGKLEQANATPILDRARLLATYQHTCRRLFLFDYDGTLTSIVQDPHAAAPSDRIIRTLETLAADPHNSVWIISGRDQAFLDHWMGRIHGLGLSAEHGSFVRQPYHETWENMTEMIDMSWQNEVMDVFQHYTEQTPGSFIERKKVALTWHYRRGDPEFGAFQAKECRAHLEANVCKKSNIECMEGKANLEVRPCLINKGAIANRLVAGGASDEPHSDIHKQPDFVLCFGDDFTDEDMFRALKASQLSKDAVFTCTVGPSSKQTTADWHLPEPADVVNTVGMLNGCMDAINTGPGSVVEGMLPESRL